MTVHGGRDDRDAAERGQGGYRGRQPETGGVENHVGTAGIDRVDLCAQIFRFIQLQGLITLILQVLDLFPTSGGRQHPGTAHLGQGQRGTADCPATDDQQSGFGRHQAAFQCVPRRGVRHTEAGGLGEAQMRGFERHAVGRQFDELRVGTVGEKAQFLARAPDFLTDHRLRAGHDNTGKVTTGNPRQGGVGKTPQHVLHIAGVEAGGLDLDQHFIGAGHRRRHLDVAQGREITGFIELQSFHGRIHRIEKGSGDPASHQPPPHRPELFAGEHAEQAHQRDGRGCGGTKIQGAVEQTDAQTDGQ
ncbi:hypothetical protein D3C87_1098770 [compost metagenome]